jgi:hypothetical protein
MCKVSEMTIDSFTTFLCYHLGLRPTTFWYFSIFVSILTSTVIIFVLSVLVIRRVSRGKLSLDRQTSRSYIAKTPKYHRIQTAIAHRTSSLTFWESLMPIAFSFIAISFNAYLVPRSTKNIQLARLQTKVIKSIPSIYDATPPSHPPKMAFLEDCGRGKEGLRKM